MDSFKEKINNLIAAPEYQDQADYQLLCEQVNNYPYCQSLRLAIARHSKVYQLADSESLVALAAIYTPDRIVLFNLMGLPNKKHSQEPKAPETIESSLLPDREKNELSGQVSFVAKSFTDATESIIPIVESAAPVAESLIPVPDNVALTVESSIPIALVSTPLKQKPVNIVPEITHWAAKKAVLDRKVSDEAPVRKTFLYWLKKTQKGYFLNSTNTDNFVSTQSDVIITSVLPDPLEQHYQANIFVLPVNDSAENSQAIEFDSNKKEDQLIKKFLIEDPQHIKPNHPLNDQDNVDMLVERASKDAGIVTETLAAIYYQQKQYEKALKAYDDLRLKFPNKSAYFADLHEKIRNEVADNK